MTLDPAADQLRRFTDSVPTLAWSAASDGAAESFNQRWLDYTGLSASEGSGAGWQAAIHPDDLPRLLDTFQRARESGHPFEFEVRLRRFDGEFRRFLMRGERVQDERGCIVTWYGTNIDLEDPRSSRTRLGAADRCPTVAVVVARLSVGPPRVTYECSVGLLPMEGTPGGTAQRRVRASVGDRVSMGCSATTPAPREPLAGSAESWDTSVRRCEGTCRNSHRHTGPQPIER